MMNTSERKSLLENEFVERLGKPPVLFVLMPSCVDLMCSHTDYNFGSIPRKAIDRNTRTDIYEAIVDVPGNFNSRGAGAGFGGCEMAFVWSDPVDSFAQQGREHNAFSTSIDPERYLVQAV
jgi:galactokinase